MPTESRSGISRIRFQSAFTAIILCAVAIGSPRTSFAQAKTFEVGLRVAATVPTTNFKKLASVGASAGGYVGWWNSDYLLVLIQTSYDQFSEKTLDDGSKQTVAFIPFEFGIRYYPEFGTGQGFYVGLAGGAMAGRGEFSGMTASLSVAVGYLFNFSGNRVMLDATYRSEIADPFNSYLLLGLIYAFGSGK